MSDVWLIAAAVALVSTTVLAFFGPRRQLVVGWQLASWCMYVGGALTLTVPLAWLYAGLTGFTVAASFSLAVLLLGLWFVQCDIGMQMYLQFPTHRPGPDDDNGGWGRDDDPDDTPPPPGPSGGLEVDWDAFDRDRAAWTPDQEPVHA